MILYNNTIWNNMLIIRQNKTTEKQLNGQDLNCDTINKIFVNIVFIFLLKPNQGYFNDKKIWLNCIFYIKVTIRKMYKIGKYV